MSANGAKRETLYSVLCPSFHGATLLSLLLNNHPEIMTLGDTNPTRAYDQICACGNLVSECPFWQTITRECRAERFARGPNLLPTLPTLVTTQGLNRALTLTLAVVGAHVSPKVWRVAGKPFRDFAKTWDTFREVARTWGDARLVIDGQKSVAKLLACHAAVGGSAKVIHLTRDPRAFAHSCRKHRTEDWPMAVAGWNRGHRHASLTSRLFGPEGYLRIRYEDLAQDPPQVMQRVFDFLDVPNVDVCDRPKNRAKHHLMGNKMLRVFDGHVRYDTSWRRTWTDDQQRMILKAAEPLASRFGYAFAAG